MGAVKKLDIHGAKGGSTTPKSPTEATDSLRSTNLAKILIAVGEGEFDGSPTAADIYLDNTPINDASGNVNFPSVKWEWRTGAVDQPHIPGIPAVENETSVNVELRSDTPWVRSLNNTQLSALRVRFAWPALQQQDEQGNVGGHRIEYAIDLSTDGGPYRQVLIEAVDGKTTTRYERSRRIDLPSAESGWQIRVRRITPNQNTNKIADAMLIAGYTEVIDAKLRYPNTALLYVEFDAEQFTNIPAVTVECNGRKWQVPSNYDPVNRTYLGIWDGTFKLAWTNNPAWITYGICTVDRFGLGKRIKPFMVDKWELYRIAQYCDQGVPDGMGGEEPRFLCDMNLQAKSDAWTLLRDISAIYRGMTYWAQGQLVMQADMPRAQDFDYVFTRANVIDGKFSYGSASATTRYTRAVVSYDNPANNYDTDVTTFADIPLQRRFGDRPVEISAIGCTRASEAQRRGKWAVMSNNQDRTVSFKTGMEGVIPLPGYIIPVADSLLAGREMGGRISTCAGRVVTLDRNTDAKAGDRLIINLPSGKAEARTVRSVAGRAITVTAPYSEPPAPQLQWALDADDLAVPLYRVLSTKRTVEGDYEISALQYEPHKFAYIDTGARLEERPISVIPITVVAAPASVALSSSTAIAQGLAVTTLTITWPAVSGAVAYDVEWRKDNGNWIKVQRTGATSVDIVGIYAGAYLARVRAISAFDISSIWRTSPLTRLSGKEGLPPAVTSLTATSLVYGISLAWTFPAGAEDTQRTEIWSSKTPAFDDATKFGDFAYPQARTELHNILAGATFYFWARLVDRTGNIGPWYPEGMGLRGQASADQSEYEEYFAGQIGESALGQHLNDRIDLIDGPADLPGSVNGRIEHVTGEVEAIAERVDGVFAELKPPLAGDEGGNAGDATRFVGVWSEQSARIEDGIAIGKRVDNVQVKVDDTSAAVQQVSQAVVDLEGKASAMWSVKLQLNQQGQYVAAGIGLSIENTDAGLQSQFLVSADRFAVVNSLDGGSLMAPFVVQNGQTFISQALIGNGWITNAMIGNYIQSHDYTAGLRGWRLDKAGVLELNGSNGNGRMQLTNTAIRFYHPNGVLGVDLSL
ncbi:host specificity protein J [Pseudomonas sp. NPDC087358]|uniref:host specificity protein J n=1 Tax=Pseudomonas sp. NPDC087358 TaxID=3364439 RepID=UPI00384F1B98